MESCFSIHTFYIPTRQQPVGSPNITKEAAINSRSTTVMTATSPTWRAGSAVPQRAGVLGLWGTARTVRQERKAQSG